MCIIVYKPIGKPLPSETILKNCFDRNPDGAGFMYHTRDKVIIHKGLMTWNSFKTMLDSIKNRYNIEKMSMVLHFRITTQGGTNQQCTHPFPLSENMNDLKLLNCKSDIGIAHNGIISLTTTYYHVDYSDTMKFITDYLSLIITKRSYYKSKKTLKLIKNLAGSKLAIMDGSGHVELIGDFIEEDGIYYSNSTYCQPKVQTTYKYPSTYSYYGGYGKYGYNTYDEDDYDDYYYNPKSGLYDYDESYCPKTVYNTDVYCKYCSNKDKCTLLNKKGTTKTQEIFTTDLDKLLYKRKVDGKDHYEFLKNTKEHWFEGDILHVIAYDSDENMYDVEYCWDDKQNDYEPLIATLVEDAKE